MMTASERIVHISGLLVQLNQEIQLLNDSTKLLDRESTLQRIAHTVAAAFKVDPSVMITRKRNLKCTVPRLMFYHIARVYKYRFKEIATYVDRNHSTIIQNCNDHPLTKMAVSYPEYETQIIDSIAFNGLNFLISTLER